MVNIKEKLWQLAKEAESPEVCNAYMIALLYVQEYLNDLKEENNEKTPN